MTKKSQSQCYEKTQVSLFTDLVETRVPVRRGNTYQQDFDKTLERSSSREFPSVHSCFTSVSITRHHLCLAVSSSLTDRTEHTGLLDLFVKREFTRHSFQQSHCHWCKETNWVYKSTSCQWDHRQLHWDAVRHSHRVGSSRSSWFSGSFSDVSYS